MLGSIEASTSMLETVRHRGGQLHIFLFVLRQLGTGEVNYKLGARKASTTVQHRL